jgi:predicted aldo/keto reductase-like oxidoreductase
MKYRKLGSEKVSALGFGCMRLPVIDNDQGKINEPEATRIIHYAIEHGVNYVDTAWGYHRGESEPFVGRALQGGWRDKVQLATKLPQWLVKTHEDCDKYLNEQLKKMQTDHFDFYLVHALGKGSWEKLAGLDVGKFLDRAIRDGRIGFAGFSYHDEAAHFAPIVDAYPWTFCQIQYNYMDEESQAGTAGLKYAASKGLNVIAMEPLRGGKLAQRIPLSIRRLLEESEIDRTMPELALKWVWNHPEVSCVLSGMTEMEQVVENVRVADDSLPNSVTPQELEVIETIKRLYIERTEVPCTKCGYCMPCPNGVDIPEVLRIYNDLHIYSDEGSARMFYNMFMKPEARADKCIECGECEGKCPQGIKIIETLKKAHASLGAKG